MVIKASLLATSYQRMYGKRRFSYIIKGKIMCEIWSHNLRRLYGRVDNLMWNF